MKEKRLTDRSSRLFARAERDSQWRFMERAVREGIVWICPWDKYSKHKNGDGVYVFGLLGSNEFYAWLDSHKDWWKKGRWSEKRCAASIRITEAGRVAFQNQHLYDMEPIHGGMVEPGFVVRPWPRRTTRVMRGQPHYRCDRLHKLGYLEWKVIGKYPLLEGRYRKKKAAKALSDR